MVAYTRSLWVPEQEAKASLEVAAELAAAAGPSATETEVAACSYWRGRVMWAMGGEQRSKRSGAHAAFLAAAGAAGTHLGVSDSGYLVVGVCLFSDYVVILHEND